MRNSTSLAAGVGLLVLLAAAGAVGCGDARAEALDVTYYYLPG